MSSYTREFHAPTDILFLATALASCYHATVTIAAAFVVAVVFLLCIAIAFQTIRKLSAERKPMEKQDNKRSKQFKMTKRYIWRTEDMRNV